MDARKKQPTINGDAVRSDILYAAQMLGELSQILRPHNADMLCYFIEMAYAEAQDILDNKSKVSLRRPP